MRATEQYSAQAENQYRDETSRELAKCQRKGDHAYYIKNKAVLQSPDGKLWALSVDNDGALSAVAFG